MRKLSVLLGLMVVGLAATASPAAAVTFACDDHFAGGFYDDVVVKQNQACTLQSTTVTGNVTVRKGAYFEADNTAIGGRLAADTADTVYIHTFSSVAGQILNDKTRAVYLFDSTAGQIQTELARQVVNICGMTVTNGDLVVWRPGSTTSGGDVLVGDPLTADCAGNTVQNGGIAVSQGYVDVELNVRGNSVTQSLEVYNMRGPAAKAVENNSGGTVLYCRRNETPFTASGNAGFTSREGQCNAP